MGILVLFKAFGVASPCKLSKGAIRLAQYKHTTYNASKIALQYKPLLSELENQG
jgi:hypothetical protein